MTSRSAIDLLTNQPILRGFDRSAEILLATLGIYPERVLPQFTHELTHHWCFNSPVGIALALLELEAAAITIDGHYSVADRTRARDALIKSRLVIAILRPISEGLAQFAEFDLMVTTHGQLVSAVTRTLREVFGRKDDIKMSPPQLPAATQMPEVHLESGQYAGPLAALRTLPETIGRKSGLLSSPLTIDGDAYLLGYLMTKTLWISAYMRYWRLSDTDLFMMLVRAYVFADSRLTAMLLDTAPISNESLNELIAYCVGRQFELFSCDIQAMATSYEAGNKDLAPGRRGSVFEIESIPWETPEQRRRGDEAISAMLERLELTTTKNGKMFFALAEKLVQRREAMRVFAKEVWFECDGDSLRAYNNNELVYAFDPRRLDTATAETLVGASGSAELFVYLKPFSGRQFCVLKIGSPELVLSEPITPGLDGSTTEGSEFVDGTISSDLGELTRLGVEEAIRRSGHDFERAERAALAEVERDYLKIALFHASEPQAVREKMREGGFWDLLGGDTEAVEQLARVSCWSSLALSYESQDALCRSHGFTLRHASEKLQRYSETTGFTFFGVNSDGRPVSLA